MNLTTTRKLHLDFHQKDFPMINACQYDKNTRYVNITCTDGSLTVILDSTIHAEARTLTEDGRALLDTVTVQSDGTLLFLLDDTLLATPGRAIVQIDLYQSNGKPTDSNYDEKYKRLTTMKFAINVEEAVYSDETIMATDEFNALTDLINKAISDYKYVMESAQKSADSAKASANSAATSATTATNQAKSAANSASAAKTSETNAKTSENNAKKSESNAKTSETNAKNYSDLSKSYAVGTNGQVRAGDATDNSKYYYEQTKSISEGLAGGQVIGVKGNAESSYRKGNVNLTPANIGAVNKTGDTMSGTLNSSRTTGSYLAGNKGTTIINSTAAAGAYTILAKLNSTNGYFTDGVYQGKRLFQYTAKSTVDGGNNSVTKSVTLLDESGNSSFPGTVTAPSFNGNATSATKATQDSQGNTIYNEAYSSTEPTTQKTNDYWCQPYS